MTREVVPVTEVYVVFKVSEEVTGGHVAIQTLKAFMSRKDADAFVKEQESGRRKVMIEGVGELECDVQVGVHPAVLE